MPCIAHSIITASCPQWAVHVFHRSGVKCSINTALAITTTTNILVLMCVHACVCVCMRPCVYAYPPPTQSPIMQIVPLNLKHCRHLSMHVHIPICSPASQLAEATHNSWSSSWTQPMDKEASYYLRAYQVQFQC